MSPTAMENGIIILVYKQKNDRAKCGNSRGISLISVAGKVLAKIMLIHLLEQVVDLVLPESQCGFRHGRSTIDMIFVARQLQEKCCEQHQDLYMAFVDLTKAFHTVNRDLLWNILRKLDCPPTFIAILQQFHTGMCAQVVMAGSQSSSFPVEVGVKQDCVLAPIIFNLLLVAITLCVTVTCNHLIALEISIFFMVVSSTSDISRPKLRLLQQLFLPSSTPMMQPFPALLLTDINVVLISCPQHTSVQAS